ncbi:MAG: potassium transporter KtrB [Lachnospiraceae bacterium]|nr:potassium transporter KtrB [Lachnospiraceae bacterium]
MSKISIQDENYSNLREKNKKEVIKKGMSTTKKIVIGFLLVIIVGTILLSLPISTVNGESNILVALFTATTSVCVTGLVVVDTFSYWTLFGKVVILLLIQIGGMGIIAIICGVMLVLNKKVNLKERMVIQDAYNLNNLHGVIKFIKKIIIGTFVVETIGALLYMIEFIPRFGVGKGIWFSIFNSISAFCNAGIDIISPDSLIPFQNSPIVLITTMMLIFNGGIGFVVWWDVMDVAKLVIQRKIALKDFVSKLKIHTRLVLAVTFGLIFTGAILILLFEYNNEGTISNMSFGDKILNSLFQSVTLRTAGFASFSQGDMESASVLVCVILMLIGGSPVGTAGGVKTVTVIVLLFSVIAVVKGRKEAVIYNRSINQELIRKSLAVVLISLIVFAIMSVLLMVTNDFAFEDSIFEVASAVATVGLTRGITSDLNVIGQIIIIVSMYLGRIGPISMFIAFSNRYSIKNSIHYAEADLIVG